MGKKAKAAVTDLGKGSLEPQLEEEAQMDLKPPVKSINSTQPSQACDASATRGPCRALKEISISPKCSPFKREGGEILPEIHPSGCLPALCYASPYSSGLQFPDKGHKLTRDLLGLSRLIRAGRFNTARSLQRRSGTEFGKKSGPPRLVLLPLASF